MVEPQITTHEDIDILVRRTADAAAEAERVAMDGYLIQLRELADAAEAELAFTRKAAAGIAQDSGNSENWGEGFWEVTMTEVSARHVNRFAREAKHWANCYADARANLLAGRPAFRWGGMPAALAAERTAVEAERSTMQRSI